MIKFPEIHNEIVFDFHKRHTLPLEVITASDLVLPLGRDLILRGLSIKISAARPDATENINAVFIFIQETSITKNPVAIFIFDTKDCALYPFINNKIVKDKSNTITITTDLINYINSNFDENYNNFIEDTVATSSFLTGDYYVYRHVFSDGRTYFGKGIGNRISTDNKRNDLYEKAKNDLGNPFIEVICENITEEDAYTLESMLITKGREHYGHSFIVNITSGLEQAEDVGDMPINTILRLQKHRYFNLQEPRFLTKVNIFRRYSEEIGSAKEYYQDITIFQAARIVRVTMNEVIAALNSSNRVIGNFKVLSNDELQRELLRK
jgi:hypothetical protein